MIKTLLVLIFMLPAMIQAKNRVEYPHAKALQIYWEKIIKTINSGNNKGAGLLIRKLVLKNPHFWFKKAFGKKLGAKAANDYKKFASFLQSPGAVRGLKKILQRRNVIKIVPVRKNKNPFHYHNNILALMKKKMIIYEVRLLDKTCDYSFFDLGYFCCINNHLRSVGDLLRIRRTEIK